MSYFRNDAWKVDLQIREHLQKYVGQLFKREEILSFLVKDYVVTLEAFAHSIGCEARKVFDLPCRCNHIWLEGKCSFDTP